MSNIKEKIAFWVLNQISRNDPIDMRVRKYKLLVQRALHEIPGNRPAHDIITSTTKVDENYDVVTLIKISDFDFCATVTADSRLIMIDIQMRRANRPTITLRTITAVIDASSMADLYKLNQKTIHHAKNDPLLPDRHPRFENTLINQRLLPLFKRLIAIQAYVDFRHTRAQIEMISSQIEYSMIMKNFREFNAKLQQTTLTNLSRDHLVTASEIGIKIAHLRRFALEAGVYFSGLSTKNKIAAPATEADNTPLTKAIEDSSEFEGISFTEDEVDPDELTALLMENIRLEKELFVPQPHKLTGPTIDIYNVEDILKADPNIGGDIATIKFESDADAKRYKILKTIHVQGEAGAQRRLAPATSEQIEHFAEVEAAAPHLADLATRIRRRMALSQKTQTPLYIPPLLLNGPPGNSKTWFCERLAKALDLPFFKQQMSNSSLSDTFVGADMMWKAARQGLVANALLNSDVANPIIFIDEFDKMQPHSFNNDPYRPFYSLFEKETSGSFADEYLKFPLDARHIIWIATSNSIDSLPEPIVDRLTVVHAPPMTTEQKKQIIRTIYAEKVAHYHNWHAQVLPEPVLAKLTEISLRQTIVAIDDLLASAADNDRREPTLTDLPASTAPSRQRIGF